MKRIRLVFLFAAFVAVAGCFVLSSCSNNDDGKKAEEKLVGKWVNVYDPETEGEPTERTIMEFGAEGNLTYVYNVEDPEYEGGCSIQTSGNWKVNGNKITIYYADEDDDPETAPVEFDATYKLNGNTLELTMPEGDVLELQKQEE